MVLTIASWLYTRHRIGPNQDASLSPIKILGEVPRGFQHLGRPDIDPELLKVLASELPVATIILLLEHVAIAKCKPGSCLSLTSLMCDRSVRSHQWLQDQPQPGAHCYWRDEQCVCCATARFMTLISHSCWLLLRCLSGHGIVFSFRAHS